MGRLTVRVRIGPLPSAWVLEWALDAREAVRRSSSGTVELPFRVGRDFFEHNRALVREWVRVASGNETFEWDAHGDPDALLTFVQYWRNLAMVRADLLARGESPPMHPDAERFADTMRLATLDALVDAGRMTAETARRMHETWPRLSAGWRADPEPGVGVTA